jgi:hypothetical protein
MDATSPTTRTGEEGQLLPGGPPPVMPGLEAASKRLFFEFRGAFTTLAIKRQLRASYDSLASTSTVHNFLSVLAERSAREQLRVLAARKASALHSTPAASASKG